MSEIYIEIALTFVVTNSLGWAGLVGLTMCITFEKYDLHTAMHSGASFPFIWQEVLQLRKEHP